MHFFPYVIDEVIAHFSHVLREALRCFESFMQFSHIDHIVCAYLRRAVKLLWEKEEVDRSMRGHVKVTSCSRVILSRFGYSI